MSRKLLPCLLPALLSVMTVSAQTTANVYVQHNLVSDVPGLADITDPNLVDPWGMSFSATSPFWVSNHGKGNTTVYTAASSAIAIAPLVVTIPSGNGGPAISTATGQVSNTTAGFILAGGKKASFIFCTEDGTVSAWNAGAAATLMVDFSAAGAVYKGMAIGTNAAGNPLIYLANFSLGKIDVFDTNFKLTTVSGGFGDANLPAGYAPFNIWQVNNKLYVTFAKQDATKKNDVAGVGNGVVDIFDFDGNLLQRVSQGGPLNSPWGVAVAGGNWGALSNSILVGNFGDGKINAFNPTTGALIGTMQDSTGAPISIQGLWAIAFGNGGSGGDAKYLYFTAGIFQNGVQHGLLGSLAPPPQISVVQNTASAVTATSVAPGEVVTLTGFTIGPRPAVTSPSLGATGNDGTTLGGTTVMVNGTAAPILYTSADQTNIIIPWGVTGTNASIVVTAGTTVSATTTVPLATTAPGLFMYNGQCLAYNQDGTVNAAANAATAGSVVVLYATGLGQTSPPQIDGARESSLVLAETVAPVAVTIGGQPATVIYAGSAPGQISGVMQIEAVVPATAGTGAVPVVVTMGTATSQPGATITLK
jgi:uncharacterized protein (TIGR03118 family)